MNNLSIIKKSATCLALLTLLYHLPCFGADCANAIHLSPDMVYDTYENNCSPCLQIGGDLPRDQWSSYQLMYSDSFAGDGIGGAAFIKINDPVIAKYAAIPGCRVKLVLNAFFISGSPATINLYANGATISSAFVSLGPVEWDITDLFNGWKNGSIPNNGIYIGPPIPRMSAYFCTSEYPDPNLRPALTGISAQCLDVILGAVSGPTVAPNGHCISANFTPKLGYSLTQAASLCDYDHFNWYSLIERDLHPPGSLTSPYVDPPTGGGLAFGGFADNLPFYWDETGSSSSAYHLANHVTTRSLDFSDCPGEPSLQPGEYISYVTSLVGVFPNGKFDILNSFEWYTDYNGSVGGIGVRRNLIEPTGGTSGGSVVVQTNLVVYNLPGALLQRMVADGALNAVPTLAVWRTGSGITISWPASATNYVLESSFVLGNSFWTNVVGVVSNSVTLPISSNGMFFRLRK